MDSTIIVAIITGICTIVGVLVTSLANSKNIDLKLDKQQAVFEAHVSEKIASLQSRVEKHNQVIERTYKLEMSDARQNDEIKRLGERIKVLELKPRGGN